MKFTFCFVFAVFCSFYLFAETSVEVSVDIPGQGTLEFYQFSDNISGSQSLIESFPIPSKGNKKIKIEANDVQKIKVRFRNYFTEFYVLPNSKYHVSLNTENSEPIRHQFERKYLFPIFLKQDQIQFNYKAAEIDYLVDSVVSVFIQKYRLRVPIKKLDSTLVSCDFSKSASPFLKAYEEFSKFKGVYNTSLRPLSIGASFLSQRLETIKSNDLFAAEALNLVASDFYSGLKEIDKDTIFSEINQSKFGAYQKIISKNTNISDMAVVHLFLYKCLYQHSFQKGFDRLAIIRGLNNISEGEHEFVNRVRKNITELLSKNTKGNIAFSNQIITPKDTLELATLFDKPVYLNFWNEKCEVCKEDMRVIAEIAPQFKNVNFVSIYLGENATKFYLFDQTNPSRNWHLSFAQNPWSFIDHYDIQALPLYYFIHSGGNFLLAPARGPYHRSLAILDRLNKNTTTPGYWDVREYDE